MNNELIGASEESKARSAERGAQSAKTCPKRALRAARSVRCVLGGQEMSSPSFGFRTLAVRMDHLLGQTAQVVDHDQAEHDGNGPDFTDRQGRDCLVSLHEPCDVVLIEATVAVGDQLQGQRVNSRKARDRTVRKLRE